MVSPAQLLFLASSTAFFLFGHIVVNLVASSSSSSSSSNGRCPSSAEDINVQANRCLENYKAFEDRYQLTGSHLFTSVDVEIIRTLCSDLKTSMRCLRSLRDRCSMVAAAPHQKQQQQQHHHVGQIDAVIRPYLSVVELCDHQHLYEEYAMNQNCLHGQRDMSEQCHRTFQTQTERPTKSTEHVHLQQYCRHLTQLMTCVRSNFALICGESAATLIEQLVKAAVDGSHRCRNGGSHTHLDDHPSTMLPQKSGRVGSLRRSNSAQTIHHNYSICRRIGQLIISVTLSMSSAFVVNAFRN